ncbi:MAG: AAA family ATPase [Acidiferrobacterales bacterium]
MYNRHFGLKENPFSIAPDPRYLYLSRRHQEALAHLIYGVTEGGGFVQLTGDVGVGKTMLIRALLERLPDDVDVALILYPILSVQEFVCAICDELRIPYSKESVSLKVLIDALNAYLLENHAKGRRTVLIIDEAQNLSRDVLEQLRLLTNLETNTEKLLQILLVGQPELSNMLAQRDLRQLAQRITARYSLKALFPHETSDYIMHRCRVAGGKSPMFSRSAARWVHRLSGGVPRTINIVCDRALLGAYARGKTDVPASTVRRAADQVGRDVPKRFFLRPSVLALVPLTALAMVGGWQFSPTFMDIWNGDGPVALVSSPYAQVATSLPEPSAQGVIAAQEKQEPVARTRSEPTVKAEQAPGGLPEAAVVAKSVSAEEGKTKEPTVAEVLASPQTATDTETAFTGLFARWGLNYGSLPGNTGCARAAKSGLRCIFRSGTWNNLRHLNRPAVIELIDDKGQKHHVLVSALDGDRVASDFGGEQYEFPISELDRYWYGQYLLLWKPPISSKRTLRRGTRDKSVIWLRNALARYNGKSASSSNSRMFDKDLEEQVKAFQRDHHLLDDGVVGRLTLIQLNTYDNGNTPPLLWDAKKARTG